MEYLRLLAFEALCRAVAAAVFLATLTLGAQALAGLAGR
jgi:hypothetical protein